MFLARPPEGYNVALAGAQVPPYIPRNAVAIFSSSLLHEKILKWSALSSQGRRDLLAHCASLAQGEGQPNTQLLRSAAYEFVWSKLEQKHDLWRTGRGQHTTLQALLCAVL